MSDLHEYQTIDGSSKGPGDLVLSHAIGVVVVPGERLTDVAKLAREPADREEATRRAIMAGATVEDLLARFGRI